PLINKEVMEITSLVEAKGICLETEIAQELPSVKLDRERVLQVLRNLIGNAVKFTPKAGRVKVAARAIHDKIEVSVRDTGPGVPEENHKTILDKLHQASRDGAFSAYATGL